MLASGETLSNGTILFNVPSASSGRFDSRFRIKEVFAVCSDFSITPLFRAHKFCSNDRNCSLLGKTWHISDKADQPSKFVGTSSFERSL